MNEPRDALYSTSVMLDVFSSKAHVRAMLAFEAALAHAEARAGIIPLEAAASIEAQCNAKLFDIAALYREAVDAGTPAIPLVRLLTARVGSDDSDKEAQKYVHWGATSQDAIDTALMLQMCDGIDLLLSVLGDVCAACARLAEEHRHTLMVGRTLLQQALPITFGLKAARWLALVTRQLYALRMHRVQTLAVQLGGAAGTLASLGDKGPQVVTLLAEELGLVMPDLPWHTERDRVAEIAATLGIVAGAMAKIAGDVVLLAQTEVGEVSEHVEPGKGGSSAMPQKRNPVEATRAIASSRLAIGVMPVLVSGMAQEHERGVGGWQAEWDALPELFCYTSGAVEGVRDALSALEVDSAHMKANLDLTHGLVMAESLTMALTPRIGRPQAYRIVQSASKQAAATGKSLRQIVQGDEQVCSVLSQEEIDAALDPAHYLGSTDVWIDRALEAYHDWVHSDGGSRVSS